MTRPIQLEKTYRLSGVNNVHVTLDFEARTICFVTKSGTSNYKFGQIAGVELCIEQDELFLYGLRKHIARLLLCCAPGRFLAQWHWGRVVKKRVIALCQHHLIKKVSHIITINDQHRTTHEIVFMRGIAVCGSSSIRKILSLSGSWLCLWSLGTSHVAE